MLGSCSRSAFTRLVLPAPEGATTTKRLPRIWTSTGDSIVRSNGVPAAILLERAHLFYVLDLLAHLLDEHLQLHRDARHVVRDRLRSEGVRLAIELLAEEVQALAARAALLEDAADFRDVGDQPRELLVDVDARGVEHDLLLDALVGGRGSGLGAL